MTKSPEPPWPGQSAHPRAPDFFIVGHPKCGTTALYEMLRAHPQIHMPVKETWYLASDLLSRRPSPMPGTLEQYLALFAAAAPGQVIGEATPSYLRSRVAAERIAELRPDARIIAILREPASFLRSFHLQSVQSHVESEKDFATALELEAVRREGSAIPQGCPRPEALLYSEHVRYVEQLRRYADLFPPEQLLVLVYDDFRGDNHATVRRVLRFLKVNEHVPLERVKANPSVRLRSRRGEQLLSTLYQGGDGIPRLTRDAIKLLTPRRLRRAALDVTHRRIVYGDPAPPDEDLMLAIKRRFRSEVIDASGYLERDLVTLWGYDRIG